jgi:hypothetical protein
MGSGNRLFGVQYFDAIATGRRLYLGPDQTETNDAIKVSNVSTDPSAYYTAGWLVSTVGLTGNSATAIAQGVRGEGKSTSAFNFTSTDYGLRGVTGIATHAGSGTITRSVGVIGVIQNTSTGTLSTAFATLSASGDNTGGGTITNLVGHGIANQSAGTNNTILLIGTLTPPAGNYAIYNGSAYANYFAGASTFASTLTVNTLTSGRVPYASTSGLLTDSSNMTFDGSKLSLAATGSGGGVRIGGDVDFYRSATNQGYIPDYLQVAGPTHTSTSATQSAFNSSITFTPSGATSGRAWGLYFTSTASSANNFTDNSGGIVGVEGNVINNSTGTMTAAGCMILNNSFGANSTTSRFTGLDIYGPEVSGSAGTGATVTDHQSIILRHSRSSGNTSLGNVSTSMLLQFRAATWSGTGHVSTFTNIGYLSGHTPPAYTANGQTRIFIDIPAMPNPGAYTGTTGVAIRFASSTAARDGLLWGTDTNLYRGAADNLKTDDKFSCGSLQVGTSSTSGQALCASDSSGNVTFQTIVNKRSLVVTLCGAFTPAGTGGDAFEFTLPYSPTDGTTSVTWNLRRITLRVNVAGGAPAVTIEKSTATGAFSATTMGSVTMGSGNYEVSATGGFSSSTVASGNKLRMNPTALGTATGWTVTCEFEAS